jgi:hypothetical protein
MLLPPQAIFSYCSAPPIIALSCCSCPYNAESCCRFSIWSPQNMLLPPRAPRAIFRNFLQLSSNHRSKLLQLSICRLELLPLFYLVPSTYYVCLLVVVPSCSCPLTITPRCRRLLVIVHLFYGRLVIFAVVLGHSHQKLRH